MTHRETEISDEPLLKELMAKDPAHRDVSPTFFIEKTADGTKTLGVKCLVVGNAKGPLFFLRLENVIRVYMQVAEGQEPGDLKAAMKETLQMVHGNGRRLGYKALIFDSVSRPLIWFFSRLGFKKFPDIYKLDL